MKIEVTTQEPMRCKLYLITFANRPNVANILKDLLENEIIRKSNFSYTSGIVLAEKRNGEHGYDYRQLNKITVRIPHPMPVLDEQIAQVARDLRMGYHQMKVEVNRDHDFRRTLRIHPDAIWFGECTRTILATMNRVIEFIKPGEVLAYLDGVIIPE